MKILEAQKSDEIHTLSSGFKTRSGCWFVILKSLLKRLLDWWTRRHENITSDEDRTRWNDRIISLRKHRKDGHGSGGRFPSGLSASLFSPAREMICLPGPHVRPGLRGHGHGRCDSDPRVLFGGRRADKPLKGPVSPSSKVYQLLPGYTSRTTTTVPPPPPISGETLPPRRSICIQTTPDLVLVHFARPSPRW